ncbi:major facilitator superfamily domain-containing protein 6-like isoform 1-T4 [Pholidichthys leucotaenia]
MRNQQIDIRRTVALANTFKFLHSCAKACLLPFLTLYFRQLGLTPATTGIVMSAVHLITLVWSPLASLFSKHYNKRRVVICGSLVCSAAVALLLQLIPPMDVHTQISTCNMSDNTVPNQSLLMNSTGHPSSRPNLSVIPQSVVTTPSSTLGDVKSAPVSPNTASFYRRDVVESHPLLPSQNQSVAINSSVFYHSAVTPGWDKRAVSKTDQPKEDKRASGQDFLSSLKTMDPQHQLFFLILFIMSVFEFVSAPLEWTAEDGLFDYLDFADASDRYSDTELWCLLGAACGVGGVGLLVSQLSCFIAVQTPRSTVHFFCYAGVMVMVLPVATYLPLYLSKKRDRPSGLLKAMQLVRSSPCAVLCALTTLLVGAASSAVDNFLLWQMQDYGSTELHMGLSLTLALLSQAAFPLLAGRVSKLLSPGRMLAVGVASLSLQCIYYSFLWGPWAALPVQVLNCFSSGALWWAIKVQCEDVATPGAERSVERVYNSLSFNLGRGLGSFASGFAVQSLGLGWLFRVVAIGLMVWCVCLPLLQWKAPRQRRINYSRLLAAEASDASDSESEQERDWLDKAMQSDRRNNNTGRRINF